MRMRVLTKKVSVRVGLIGQLDPKGWEVVLLQAAAAARRQAQAPYSHFLVGAAVLSPRGRIYSGCNVERVSYTQTTHAEQNAVDSMVVQEGPTVAEAVAVVAAHENNCVGNLASPSEPYAETVRRVRRLTLPEVPVPCGHCLQIIWENCNGRRDTPLIMVTGEFYPYVFLTTIGDALTMPFGPEALGISYGSGPSGRRDT